MADAVKVAGVADTVADAVEQGAVQATSAGDTQGGKSIFKSKTFWFNIATAALSYQGALPQKAQVPVAVVGNIVLRFLTNQPILGGLQ